MHGFAPFNKYFYALGMKKDITPGEMFQNIKATSSVRTYIRQSKESKESPKICYFEYIAHECPIPSSSYIT